MNQSINRCDLIIEADELRALIGTPALRIFDASVVVNQAADGLSAHENYQQAHIPGAAFFDHQQVADPGSRYPFMVPDSDFLARSLGQLGIGNDSEVIVYASANIAWATRIWWLLRYAGHKQVRVLNGGLAAWQRAGGAVETGEHQYPPTSFDVSVEAGWFVQKEQVLAAMQNTGVTTVHTLEEKVFDQSHIRGSVCQPCGLFLNEMHTLLPDEALRSRLGEFNPDQQIITYCGGGIAATVNAVVHKLVGNPNVSVYDGSMAEWAGEALPVDTRQ